MKYLKVFEEFINKKIGNISEEDGWKIMKFDNEQQLEDMLSRFWTGKEWITREGDFDVYYWDYKDWDKDEDEYFWHKKIAIYVDYMKNIIKTKELLSEPLYKIRDTRLNRKQELAIRTWTGTEKNPKPNMGKYLGISDGYPIIKSVSGTKYRIDKNGDMFNTETGQKLGE